MLYHRAVGADSQRWRGSSQAAMALPRPLPFPAGPRESSLVGVGRGPREEPGQRCRAERVPRLSVASLLPDQLRQEQVDV